MDREKIKLALDEAKYLIENEIQNIEFIDLKNEYIYVLQKINDALSELSNEK